MENARWIKALDGVVCMANAGCWDNFGDNRMESRGLARPYFSAVRHYIFDQERKPLNATKVY